MAEISRRAGTKRRYREEPNWAVPVLSRLVEQGIVESDSTGHYRLKRSEKKKRAKRWIAPHIQKILEQSGRSFDEVIKIDEDFDPLDDLSGPR